MAVFRLCARAFHLFLSQYRILGITTHALQVVEELSKIQGCYLGAEKELASLFASW